MWPIRWDFGMISTGSRGGLSTAVKKGSQTRGRPRLLLLDEPAAGLNSSERNELATVLASSLPNETTVLIVEHDTDFVRTLCDHAVALNFGRKMAEGDPASVCGHPLVIEAYLGKDEPAHRNLPTPTASDEP